METAPLFVMIGGFLGAGKTTTVARLAKHYQSQGKRVVIVTNDQASDLVDTLLLRSQGFDVGEVAGSCFCCNFDELTDTVERLSGEERPDVILAEPVGSCTDLVATVIRPLEQVYEQEFEIAPFGVIIKPSHGFKILGTSSRRGFSPQAEYIFRKQIEEADFVIINRIDELPAAEIDSIEALMREQFPETPTLRMSARSGDGMDSLLKQLELPGSYAQRVMDVDYDVYAAGEAELGWLNAQVRLQATAPLELDRFMEELLCEIQRRAVSAETEIAHLKAIGMGEGAHAVANLVSNESEPTLSLASGWRGTQANLVVNARIAMDPDLLTGVIRDALDHVATERGAEVSIDNLQSFRPGRPVPTHRLS
jgi:G3E family GTPase